MRLVIISDGGEVLEEVSEVEKYDLDNPVSRSGLALEVEGAVRRAKAYQERQRAAEAGS